MAFVDETTEAVLAEMDAAGEGPGDDIKRLLGDMAGEVLQTIENVVRSRVKVAVETALQKQKATFWTGWYAKNRTDVVINLPLRDIKVNDFRKVLELIFGAPPAKLVVIEEDDGA